MTTVSRAAPAVPACGSAGKGGLLVSGPMLFALFWSRPGRLDAPSGFR